MKKLLFTAIFLSSVSAFAQQVITPEEFHKSGFIRNGRVGKCQIYDYTAYNPNNGNYVSDTHFKVTDGIDTKSVDFSEDSYYKPTVKYDRATKSVLLTYLVESVTSPLFGPGFGGFGERYISTEVQIYKKQVAPNLFAVTNIKIINRKENILGNMKVLKDSSIFCNR